MSNACKDKKERIGRLLQMHSNQRVDIDSCSAGDIVAVVGLKDTSTGDTLCDENAPIIPSPWNLADPVIDIAVEPKTKAEQDKMSLALRSSPRRTRRSACPLTTRPARPSSPGMGELHLEIIVDRLLREFKVEAERQQAAGRLSRAPRKEVANAEGKFVRQSGGRGQYGHAVINMSKEESGQRAYLRFEGTKIVRRHPQGVHPARRPRGIQDVARARQFGGFPREDVASSDARLLPTTSTLLRGCIPRLLAPWHRATP